MTTPPVRLASARTRKFYIFTMVATAALGAFLYGYDSAIMGAANGPLMKYFNLSPGGLGFMVACGFMGAMFGPFVGSWFCDAIGREKTLIISTLLLGVGSFMTAIPKDIVTFDIFRVVCGFGAGLGMLAVPMYIAEMAPAKMRGALGTTYQLAIVIGSVAAPLAALQLVKMFPDPMVSWRWMFGSQLVVVPILFGLLFILPPSPRWLAEKGRFDDCLRILVKVHGSEMAGLELAEIKQSLHEEVGGFRELLQPGIRYALFIGFCLAFFNNWTGWSAMGAYITNLVKMSGVTALDDQIRQYACTYGVMAFVTVISMFLIDRVGRRPLWIFAAALMAVITMATGFVFHFHLHGWPVLLVLVLCTVPHGIALGGLPWLMMSELFPTRIRAKAVATTTTFLLLIIYTCMQFFPMILALSQRTIGSAAGAFWLFTVVDIGALFFGLKLMPETKGRSLEDIAESMRSRKKSLDR